ncbi:hypothetical protein BGY98DRAFT_974852 [Russula aff. rugulosa BPL654]|nr:hypothetical protein BGY98DRAFT_974852 [Russula aff. rugulosa BPL654]
MLFLPDMSSPSCMPVPVFDAHPNNQDRLDRFQGGCYDKANACATSQLAAGSICSPPFPLTSPPSLDVYSFDQWTPLINSDISSDLYSGFCLGFSVSDPSFSYGTQDSVSSSPNSSTPPSSMASPLGDDGLLYLTSPALLSHGSSSPFKASEGGQDLVVPALPHQCHTKLFAADAPNFANRSSQGTVDNNLSTVPGNFIASPILAETTALGLYYSDTTQIPDNDASVPCAVQRVPPPAPPGQNWTFRAVDPAAKVSRSKLVQDKARTSDHVLTTAAPTTTSHAAKDEPVVECRKCGYLQSTKRMGDFRRHLKKHDADHFLRSGHLTHWYDGHPFYGGCGRSYSRMDALQRHLKKSGCIGGSAKDHQSWRRLYFGDKTGRPHKSAMSSISSESQKSSVPSPVYSPPQASSSLL